MTQVLDRLHHEHKQISQLLDLLDDILAGFHDGREPDYEILSELLKYMEETRTRSTIRWRSRSVSVSAWRASIRATWTSSRASTRP